MKNILIGSALSVFLTACGTQPVLTPVSEPVKKPEVKKEEPKEQDTPVVLATTGGSNGGGGSSSPDPEPTPECTIDVDCDEGFLCVDGACAEAPPPPPECAEDNPCADLNETCSEGVCVPRPCTEDVECVEGAACLIDRSYPEQNICRFFSCPAIAETIDPETIVVSPSGTGTTAEEIQADIDFTISQLQLIYPDLSLLSTNITTCEIPELVSDHQAQYDALDAVRIQLDDHLFEQNQRLRSL